MSYIANISNIQSEITGSSLTTKPITNYSVLLKIIPAMTMFGLLLFFIKKPCLSLVRNRFFIASPNPIWSALDTDSDSEEELEDEDIDNYGCWSVRGVCRRR